MKTRTAIVANDNESRIGFVMSAWPSFLHRSASLRLAVESVQFVDLSNLALRQPVVGLASFTPNWF
jgi:hypothetical protein